MSFYYSFYNPKTMGKIEEGKFVGLYEALVCKEKILKYNLEKDDIFYFHPYEVIGILDRKTAIDLQKNMIDNNTLFTDIMEKYNIECIIFKIN